MVAQCVMKEREPGVPLGRKWRNTPAPYDDSHFLIASEADFRQCKA